MEEYIDVITPEGVLTGEKKTKSQIHIDGDWHRAAHIWLVNSNNEVLLQRRAKTKINHPDMWDISAAGHVSAGEDVLTSAMREVEEELGVSISKEEMRHIGTLKDETVQNNGTYINKEVNDVYLIKKDIPLSEMTKQDEEVDDLQYFSLDTLKKWIEEKNPELVQHDEEFELFFNSLG